jgi:hypothetical protein
MDMLLGILLFFVIIYYVFKLFLRYGLPWLLARFVKKQQDKYNQQQNGSQERKDGEVKIKNKTPQKIKDDKSFGEYVEFEDLDNK